LQSLVAISLKPGFSVEFERLAPKFASNSDIKESKSGEKFAFVNRFLILLAVLTIASLGQSYHEEAPPDDFRLKSPQEARELDPEYNLDVLNADSLRAYYAAWDGFNCIDRGFAPLIVTMSDYWRENYDRQTQRRVHDFCEPETKGTNPFGYLYIQAYNIRSLKITQILKTPSLYTSPVGSH
jgi:hypothetical protein